ncbi:MAG: phage antirepressor KilAC domain-containing protein [Candidatus Brocadiaceae bacterium]|nr:phage antirepressor KilAC domain-containing protein [Candidatus Brocadiaceae bacterium]
MSNSTTFIYEGKEIMVIEDKNGNLWFCEDSIINVLGLKIKENVQTFPNNFAADTCTTNDPGKEKIHANIITENSLHELLLFSANQSAKRFQNWLFSKVYPSYGKKDDDFFLIPLGVLDSFRGLHVSIEDMYKSTYKVVTHDKSSHIKNTRTIAESAKLLYMHHEELIDFLREYEFFDDYNLPKQHHIDAGLFLVRTITTQGIGYHVLNQVLITEKGIDKILDIINK